LDARSYGEHANPLVVRLQRVGEVPGRQVIGGIHQVGLSPGNDLTARSKIELSVDHLAVQLIDVQTIPGVILKVGAQFDRPEQPDSPAERGPPVDLCQHLVAAGAPVGLARFEVGDVIRFNLPGDAEVLRRSPVGEHQAQRGADQHGRPCLHHRSRSSSRMEKVSSLTPAFTTNGP
jgi:hypothetical protein